MQTIAFGYGAVRRRSAEMTWPKRKTPVTGDAKNLEVDYAHQMIYGWHDRGRATNCVKTENCMGSIVSAVATTKCNSMVMLPLTPTHFFRALFRPLSARSYHFDTLLLHKLRPLHCHFRWVFFEIHIFVRIRRRKSRLKFIVAAVWCFVFVHFSPNVAQLRFQSHYYNVPIQNNPVGF